MDQEAQEQCMKLHQVCHQWKQMLSPPAQEIDPFSQALGIRLPDQYADVKKQGMDRGLDTQLDAGKRLIDEENFRKKDLLEREVQDRKKKYGAQLDKVAGDVIWQLDKLAQQQHMDLR